MQNMSNKMENYDDREHEVFDILIERVGSNKITRKNGIIHLINIYQRGIVKENTPE